MKVRDIMTTNPETLDVNTLVSQADLNRLNAQDNDTIAQYMIKNPFTTHPDIDVSILESAMQCAPYPVKFVPVIDHGFVVGVLTQDVLSHRL